jgi:hypothetical protein
VLGAGAIQGLTTALIFRRDFARAELPPLPGENLPDSGEIPPPPENAEPAPFMRLAVPFGPFLALAAFEWLLFATELRALMTP